MPQSLVEAIKAARGRAIARAGQGRKELEHGPPLRPVGKYHRPIGSPWSLDATADREFKANVLVYRGVMALANAFGSVRWVAEVKSGDAWQADESHELQGLLNQPHAYFSRQDFNEVLAMWLALSGNALFLKTTLSGKPAQGATRPRLGELIPMIPEGIEPIPHPTQWLAGYEYRRGGKHLKWKAEDILHFMNRDPTNLYWGLSPLKPAGGVIRMDVSAVVWNATAMGNRAVPSGILTTKEKLTQAQYEEVSDQLYVQHSGPQSAGLPMLVAGGFDWTPTGQTPVEMDFIESRKMNREDILAVLGVPMVMAGYFENATLANAEVSRRIFWEDNLIPGVVERVAGGFNANVVPHFGDPGKLRVGYDITGIPALREDQLKKVTALRQMVATGVPYDYALDELEMDLPRLGEPFGTEPFGLQHYRVKPAVPAEAEPEDKPAPSETPTADAARPPANEQEREDEGKAVRPVQVKARGGVSIEATVFTTEIADAEAGLIRRAFLAIVKALRGDVSLSALREALEAADGAAAVSRLGGDRMDGALRDGLGPRLDATAARAARRALDDLDAAAPGMRLDAGRIKRWLVPYLEERVTQMAATTRAAVVETVAEWAAGRLGTDLDAAAELVRGSWGLHRQQAAGVRNLFSALLAQGKSPGVAAEQALRLARARLEERASTVAEHEAMTAANRGASIPWEQAMDEGHVAGAVATWFHADDSDVDDVCLFLEGQEIHLGTSERFTGPNGETFREPPDPHPKCRCGLIYSAITLPA